jgi:hypothetical protein
MISEAQFVDALRRLLTDLYWLRTEAVALHRLGGKDHVGIDFFKVAHTALFADHLHRLGRILDPHRAAFSLWTVHKRDSAGVDVALSRHGLDVPALRDLGERFGLIRNAVLAHIDPRSAGNPDALYAKANITGREIEMISNGLWEALREFYEARTGSPAPSGDEYSGADIDDLHASYLKGRVS